MKEVILRVMKKWCFMPMPICRMGALEQMNTLIKRMETYLSEFKEIKQFQTSVESARRASIHIYFTKEHQKSGFRIR